MDSNWRLSVKFCNQPLWQLPIIDLANEKSSIETTIRKFNFRKKAKDQFQRLDGKCRRRLQRTFTVGTSFTVRRVSSFTSLDSAALLHRYKNSMFYKNGSVSASFCLFSFFSRLNSSDKYAILTE